MVGAGRVMVMRCSVSDPASGEMAGGLASEPSSTCSFTASLLHLPCPSSGEGQQYLVADRVLQEVHRVKSACSSWFNGDYIIADGALYMCTPVDPVFMLLSVADDAEGAASAGVFCEASTLICREAHPSLSQLLPIAEKHLPSICDVKDCQGELFYRLNPSKVLAWLVCKQKQACAAFKEASPSSISGLGQQEQQQYVLGFLGEYLNEKWRAKLSQHLGIQAKGHAVASTPATRPAEPAVADQAVDKKVKVDPKEEAKKKAAASRADSKAKQMKEHASGTRKINAFFTATAKKS